MNVEIGAEAALFLEKEYINGIAVAVYEWDWLMLIRKSVDRTGKVNKRNFAFQE